jgi:dihydroxyacetone kinase
MEAVEATRSVDAKAGRAASLDKDQLSAADVPDAGAEGVKCLLQGIRDTVFPEE